MGTEPPIAAIWSTTLAYVLFGILRLGLVTNLLYLIALALLAASALLLVRGAPPLRWLGGAVLGGLAAVTVLTFSATGLAPGLQLGGPLPILLMLAVPVVWTLARLPQPASVALVVVTLLNAAAVVLPTPTLAFAVLVPLEVLAVWAALRPTIASLPAARAA